MNDHTEGFGSQAQAHARCAWATTEFLIPYHDREWGVPVHDDRVFFEFLILEGAQAGLSWETILRKRERYREVFDRFDPAKVARYDARKVAELLSDTGIVRNRAKVAAAIANAVAFLEIAREFGSFDAYVWPFVGTTPIRNAWTSREQLPGTSPEAQALSNDLRKRGFKFIGPTIVYAFMQATGLVDDHVLTCPSRSASPHSPTPRPRAPRST